MTNLEFEKAIDDFNGEWKAKNIHKECNTKTPYQLKMIHQKKVEKKKYRDKCNPKYKCIIADGRGADTTVNYKRREKPW